MTHSPTLRPVLLGGLSFAAMVAAAPAAATNPNEMLGFPLTAGTMNAPDGLATAASDPGWANAFERPLEDGSPVHLSVLRGVATATAFYLYIEAENTEFKDSDAVVLAFNPTGAAGNYHKLIIRPCDTVPGGTCTNDTSAVLAPKVSSITGTLAQINSGSGAPGGPPAGVTLASRSLGSGATVKWGVEIRLDRNMLQIPGSAAFPFYINAITTNSGVLGVDPSATNYSWPVNSPIYSNGPSEVLESASTREPRWGNATLNAAAFPAGLTIMGYSNVGLDPTKISLDPLQPNKFAATVANGPNGSNPPTANNVSVRFQFANIGLTPSWSWAAVPWTDIPAPPNPAGPKVVLAGQYQVFQTGNWTPSTVGIYPGSNPPKSEFNFFNDNRHQCILVNVTQGATLVESRQYNMDFVTVNSPFEANKQIATGAWSKGFPKAARIVLTERFHNVPEGFTWKSELKGAKQIDEHRWRIDDLSRLATTIGSKVQVSDRLRLPLSDYTLDTAVMAAGRATAIKVRPGALTLLAEGQALFGQQYVGPGGLPARTARGLISGRAPSRFASGQLIGSFDNFRTSFGIGAGTTVIVPARAETLLVRIAPGTPGIRGTWRMQATAAAEGVKLSRAALTPVAKGWGLPIAANLPTYTVSGTLDIGEKVNIDGKLYNVAVPMGSYGSYIYRVNAGQLSPNQFERIPLRRPLRPVRPIRPVRPG